MIEWYPHPPYFLTSVSKNDLKTLYKYMAPGEMIDAYHAGIVNFCNKHNCTYDKVERRVTCAEEDFLIIKLTIPEAISEHR